MTGARAPAAEIARGSRPIAPPRRRHAARAFGEQIVAAVAAGHGASRYTSCRRSPRAAARGHDREAIAAALSVLVSGIADEHDLPASLIAPRAALDRIARELPATTEGIAAELDGGHWRAWRSSRTAELRDDLLCGTDRARACTARRTATRGSSASRPPRSNARALGEQRKHGSSRLFPRARRPERRRPPLHVLPAGCPARSGRRGSRSLALLAEDLAREPAALRGRPQRDAPRRARARGLGSGEASAARDRVSPRARASSGLHRRAGRRRSRRDARRDGGDGRLARCDQSVAARRARHRSFGAGRSLRLEGRAFGINAELEFARNRRALRVFEVGPGVARQLRAACRPIRASCTKSTSSFCRASCSAPAARASARPTARYSRTPTPSSAPIHTRRWSTGSAFWRGASAASRRRPRCSANR